jgi:hypothetical protein
MSDDFQIGDVVVCVAGGPIVCPHDPLVVHDGSLAPKHRSVGRIVGIDPGFGGVCMCTVIHTDAGPGVAIRFRKLPKADDRFAEQMRALKPHREQVPA